MGATRFEEEATELAKAHAIFDRRSKHGDLYSFPNGMVVCLPVGSPSDGARCWKNTLADVKRAMRSNGIGHDPNAQDLEDEQVTETQKIERTPRPAGVHIQKRVKIVETHEQEVTVDLPTILASLGVILLPESVILLRDANGNETEGPLTFLVETRSERSE